MSIVLTVSFEKEDHGEGFQVEITEDGELILLDYDIDYDMSMVEFGEPKTKAVEVIEKWEYDPIYAICFYFGLNKYNLVYLATDWAERALCKSDENYSTWFHPDFIRNTIDAARDFANGRIDLSNLNDFVTAMGSATASTWVGQAAERAVRAAASIKSVTIEGEDRTDWTAWWASRVALSARKSFAKPKQQSELLWQIRHFIHAMECVQSGKPWPSIKETP